MIFLDDIIKEKVKIILNEMDAYIEKIDVFKSLVGKYAVIDDKMISNEEINFISEEIKDMKKELHDKVMF